MKKVKEVKKGTANKAGIRQGLCPGAVILLAKVRRPYESCSSPGIVRSGRSRMGLPVPV